MKRRRRYLADGPARRASRCTAGACARSARIRTTHSLGADGPARRASRSSAGAGARSARSCTMHSPAAAATLQTDPRDALVVPLLAHVHAQRGRTTHSPAADGPARRTSRCTAGAGTRSARIRATHSPAADRPARIDRRTCCQLSLRNVDAQSVINWTVVGQLS